MKKLLSLLKTLVNLSRQKRLQKSNGALPQRRRYAEKKTRSGQPTSKLAFKLKK